jgi:hypothetical protein
MAYNKDEVTTLADAVWNIIVGLKNGIGGDDIANLTAALMAAPAASNELKDDFDAAGLHIVARLADKFGDSRVNPVP